MNSLYNPNQKSKDALISEFVVRQEIYEDIMRDLEGSKMQHPEQHYLLVGQQGMGKTTLLLRLKYGIDSSAVLAQWLLPVAFTEEQYQISELVNLWEYVAEYLEDHYGFDGIYEAIGKHVQDKRFEEKAYEILDAALKKKKKNIVLLIDNIGDLFHKLEMLEIRRLREILQTNSRIRVIGGSAHYLAEVLDYQQPFYEFFKIMRLEGLDKNATIRLILRLGEMHGEKAKIERIVKEAPGRIETLRILTGGVPRTIAIMFGIFLDYEHESALRDLHKILDLVTPLYKHRMDDLPVQQQKIVDAVARNWEPITVKDLAARTRVASKTLSAQLNQLEKEQVVVKQDTATKNKTYMIRERFWNIWYLMRYGRRDDKEKIIWLVKFLESWLSGDELKRRIDSFVEKIRKTAVVDDQLQFFSKVYASLKNLSPGDKLKLKSVEKETKEEISLTDEEWFICAKEEYGRKNFFESFKCLSKIKNLSGEQLAFLLDFLSEESWPALREGFRKSLQEIEEMRIYWLMSFLFVVNSLAYIEPGVHWQNTEVLGLFRKFGEMYLLVDARRECGINEVFAALHTVSTLAKTLIAAGLYNAVCRVFEETQTVIDGRTIYLRDQWKPLYLALKYLYQSEELQKQPAELSAAAFEIADYISGGKMLHSADFKRLFPHMG